MPWEIIGNPSKSQGDGYSNAMTVHTTEYVKHVPADLKDAASHAEYETIMNVLKQVKFNKTKAAEVLKIDRKTLYNKIRNYEESGNAK